MEGTEKIVKYPLYTREQNLACKLSDEDIANIRKDYQTGLYSSRKLAKKYGVAQVTIIYWVNEKNRRYCIDRKKQKSPYNPELRKRKWRLQPELHEWRKNLDKHRIRDLDKKRESMRKSYKKHRLKYLVQKKIKYQENLEYRRKKNREWWAKNRAAISVRRKLYRNRRKNAD